MAHPSSAQLDFPGEVYSCFVEKTIQRRTDPAKLTFNFKGA
jgi:hypothetical protein